MVLRRGRVEQRGPEEVPIQPGSVVEDDETRLVSVDGVACIIIIFLINLLYYKLNIRFAFATRTIVISKAISV